MLQAINQDFKIRTEDSVLDSSQLSVLAAQIAKILPALKALATPAFSAGAKTATTQFVSSHKEEPAGPAELSRPTVSADSSDQAFNRFFGRQRLVHLLADPNPANS